MNERLLVIILGMICCTSSMHSCGQGAPNQPFQAGFLSSWLGASEQRRRDAALLPCERPLPRLSDLSLAHLRLQQLEAQARVESQVSGALPHRNKGIEAALSVGFM